MIDAHVIGFALYGSARYMLAGGRFVPVRAVIVAACSHC